MNRVLEVCVDGVDSALKAMRAGADRLVVCSDLILGGTTPDVNLFYEVRNHLDLPVSVLIRPRCGDYCYTPGEFEIMKFKMREAAIKELGLESESTIETA